MPERKSITREIGGKDWWRELEMELAASNKAQALAVDQRSTSPVKALSAQEYHNGQAGRLSMEEICAMPVTPIVRTPKPTATPKFFVVSPNSRTSRSTIVTPPTVETMDEVPPSPPKALSGADTISVKAIRQRVGKGFKHEILKFEVTIGGHTHEVQAHAGKPLGLEDLLRKAYIAGVIDTVSTERKFLSTLGTAFRHVEAGTEPRGVS
jgi:hypothetical protein